MGRFLNSKKASLLFKDDAESTYFVDKTALLDELIPLIDPQTLISEIHLYHPSPPIWKICDGQYDRGVFWQGQEHPSDFRQTVCQLPGMVPLSY